MSETIGRLATAGAPAHRHLGSCIDAPAWDGVWEQTLAFLLDHDVQTHVSTLFPGIDQLVASWMHRLLRRVEVVRPFPGYTTHFPPQQREYAETLMSVYPCVSTIASSPQRATSLTSATREVARRGDALLVLDHESSPIVRIACETAREREVPIWRIDVEHGANGTIRRID